MPETTACLSPYGSWQTDKLTWLEDLGGCCVWQLFRLSAILGKGRGQQAQLTMTQLSNSFPMQCPQRQETLAKALPYTRALAEDVEGHMGWVRIP